MCCVLGAVDDDIPGVFEMYGQPGRCRSQGVQGRFWQRYDRASGGQRLPAGVSPQAVPTLRFWRDGWEVSLRKAGLTAN